MLAHLLALAVALGSFSLYFSAFFFPEVHRKSDFYWSGLGLFYALVLWVCAGRITGGVLLGQMASAALLLWFGTQTVILRRLLASPEEKTNISQTLASPLRFLSPNALWQKIRGKKQQAPSNQSQQPTQPPTSESQEQEKPTESETVSATSTQSQEQEKQTESESETASTASSESEEQKAKAESAADPASAETSATPDDQNRENASSPDSTEETPSQRQQ